MRERKSCIPAILSFLLVLGAVAAVAFVIYKKFACKKLQSEEADLAEGEEEEADVEDLAEIDGEEA